MVHRFDGRPLEPALLEQILESSLHAPSAGFSQGFSMLAISEPDRLRRFWEVTLPPAEAVGLEETLATGPPVLVLTFVSKQAYLERYSRPDKEAAHMQREEAWPAPYWYVDGGMAVMLMLLRAVDLGVDGWFFGIAHGERELRLDLGIPESQQLFGVLGLGYRAQDDRKAGSSVTIPRRSLRDVLHVERW